MCTKALSVMQRGVTLVELIVTIVIIGIALAGVLAVMNQTVRSSADPLLRKQAIASAESLLEEIELQDFGTASSVTPVTQANRAAAYHIVRDYNGFSTTGILPVSGATPVAGLEGYSASVAVADAALDTVPAGSAVVITVTVTPPHGDAVQITGYRTAR